MSMPSLLLLLAQSQETDAQAPVAAEAAVEAAGESVGARFVNAFNAAIEYLDILNRPDDLLELLSRMHIVFAGVLLVVGVLCVLNGYRWHRWVIVICAFLSGFGLGWLMSRHMPQPHIVAGALALMAAVIANPLLRFSVAFFGGLTGAFVGANLWSALGYPADTVWAGALIGLIVVGMASFMMFRHVVVLFTSIGGGAMAVCGGIGLLIAVPQWKDGLTSALTGNQTLVPLLVGVAAIIGLVLQEGQMPKANAKEE